MKNIVVDAHLTEDSTKTPFRDQNSRNLFDFIVLKWENKATNKWGYIWEFFVTKGNGKLTNKTDYESYLRRNHNFNSGKPNYESCNSFKKFDQLELLKDNFIKIDLN